MATSAISRERESFGIGVVGGPTAVIDIGGLRIVTDPTFDPPRSYGYLTKLEGPAVDMGELGAVDIVLLSHDQHLDNLDESGRRFSRDAGAVVTGPIVAGRFGEPARGLEAWGSMTVPRPDGGLLRIEAVPAVHGPADAPRDSDGHVNGEVTGFVLSADDDVPTIYVSGDNASITAVREIAARHDIDIAILFIGGARVPSKYGGRPLTLTSERASDAAALLEPNHVVPVHCHGWAHFTEGHERVFEAFSDAGLQAMLVKPEHGIWLPMPGLSRMP